MTELPTRAPVLPGTPLYGNVLEFLHREAQLLDAYRFAALSSASRTAWTGTRTSIRRSSPCVFFGVISMFIERSG